MKLHIKHDFCYYDMALKKGCYELEKEKNYLVLGAMVMLPEKMIKENRYFFDLIETQKDEQSSVKVLDLFGGSK